MSAKQLAKEFNTLAASVEKDTARMREIENILSISADCLRNYCDKWFETKDCILYVESVSADIKSKNFGSMEIYELSYRSTSRRSWNAIRHIDTDLDSFIESKAKEVQLPLLLRKYLLSLIHSSRCYDTNSDCDFTKVYRTCGWTL